TLASISLSAALLYTWPVLVIILSSFLIKERSTKRKVIALFTTLIGTTLVVELFPLDLENLPLLSIFIRLSSGLGYALYSIFSKFALEKYSSLEIGRAHV